MGRPIRILLVEDAEDDAMLLVRELRRQGFEPATERVDTAEALERALNEGHWEAILSDYTMPRLGVLSALEIVKAHNLDSVLGGQLDACGAQPRLDHLG